MPSGLYDIKDRMPVLTPDEIAVGKAVCDGNGWDHISTPSGQLIPVDKYVAMLTAQWQRAVSSARMIDAMRAGYCTIEAVGAPPTSDARH